MSQPNGFEMAQLGRVQALVDDLARAIGRSVAVDDPQLGLLCASAQTGPIDQVRIDAIIDRAPPPGPVPWMLDRNIAISTRPVRLPAHPGFGMLPRICFPIRRDGRLLGYLWLFDEPPAPLGATARACRVAADLADLMWADDTVLRARAETIATLLAAATCEETAANAVREAIGLGRLPGDGTFTVHAVQAATPRPDAAMDRARLRDPLPDLARRQFGRPFLAGLAGETLLTLSRNRTAGDAEVVEASLCHVAPTAGYRTAMGTTSADAAEDLPEAARRARFTAEVAALRGAPGAPLRWRELGPWRLLYGLTLTPATVREISEDAYVLLRDGGPEHWRTALAYLDAGRGAPAACAHLAIHRATLYYRLNRVRQLIGSPALDDGWRAVALHVALTLHACLARTADTA